MSINELATALWLSRLAKSERSKLWQNAGTLEEFIPRLGDIGFVCSAVGKNPQQIKSILADYESEVVGWQNEGISIIPIQSARYPHLLRYIHDPPFLLYCRGELVDEFNELSSVAVVGSRAADFQGRELATTLGRNLAKSGVVHVSGLAVGIDAASHKGALEVNCKLPTIAVLGHGLRHCYPSCNRQLADKILDSGGVLLSAYEPDSTPRPHQFLARNRIIAGIAKISVIIQATERSGSLATARFAMEEGRDVLVVPGSISDLRYRGSNKLIKQGAYILNDLDEVFEHLPEVYRETVEVEESLSPDQQRILSKVRTTQSCEFTELVAEFPELSVETLVLELELEGALVRLPGNQIVASEP